MESRLSDSSESGDEPERPSFGNKRRFENAEPEERPAKKARYEETETTEPLGLGRDMGDKAQRMMQKMGYTEGVGLGKHGQGRLEPVELSKQRGRRGLGLHLPGLEAAIVQWDPSLEELAVVEDIDWVTNIHHQPPSAYELEQWLCTGPKKQTIDDETTFCDENILKNVLNSKSVFDRLDGNELRRARTRSNPFETIRGAFFLNRAAVKMANMDKACDFMFTKPKSLESDELLYFADVCAGPGGFSEYVLWRHKWHAKGFGFTLRGDNDFKLDDFYAGPCESFHPYYGPKNDGNVYDPENQEAFQKLVMEQTREKGLHFMMADGGFSVEGKENIQEILSKQLYLCQCLVALMVVRQGGHFVTKVFDLFTPFSAGLVYLMYRCFDRISIFKPNTSRPANSERYLICQGRREDITDVVEHLSRVNRLLLEKGDQAKDDVVQLVSLEELERDEQLMSYLVNSNNTLGRKQIVGLMKIAAFCQDPNLNEPRQAEFREKCLAHWGLPNKTRTVPQFCNPQVKVQTLMNCSTSSLPIDLTKPYTELKGNVESALLSSPYDWFFMPCVSGKEPEKRLATFYLGMGRSKVFRLEKNNWVRVGNPLLELPPDTFVYAEMAEEFKGDSRSQRKTFALHILDAFYLGGENVSNLHVTDRLIQTKKFCEALRKPTALEYARVRAKDLHSVERGLEEELYARLYRHNMKGGGGREGGPAWTYDPQTSSNDNGEESYYFVVNSVLFFKGTADHWSRHLSRKTGHKYYFNSKTAVTMYDKDRPDEAAANFCKTFAKRVVWFWPASHSLSKEDLLKQIKEKCPQQTHSHR